MIVNDVIYEDYPFWVVLKNGYYHVYEDIPLKYYAEHRMMTNSWDKAKSYIEHNKKIESF